MKMLFPIPDAAETLGIGRSRLYELMDSGQIESVHIGRRRLVPAQALEAYVESLRDSHKGGDAA
jgi:excisionase family DNA binding protein